MTTFASADLSSDESDVDFIPASPKRKPSKRSRTTPDIRQEDEAEIKRTKLAEPENRRRKAAEAFASMREEGVAGRSKLLDEKEVEMVEVKRARRFAGETLYETVMLPSSHPEAISYLAQESSIQRTIIPPTPLSAPTSIDYMPRSTSPATPSTSSLVQPQPHVVPSTASPKNNPKPPIRRKPRQSLEQMSAALSSGKKMTTLEKSQMDWKSHMAADEKVKDELEANRRSGGFLEKREFLERVGERRDGALDGAKGSRR